MLQSIFKIGFIIVLLAIGYKLWSPKAGIQEQNKAQSKTNEASEKHLNMLKTASIQKVTDNVYVAVGYALANMVLFEGTDGIIIVDTTESPDAALKVYNEFQNITTKPIKAIIITHFHGDHALGAAALLEASKDSGIDIKVFTHSTTNIERKKAAISGKAGYKRVGRQFGIFLEKEEAVGPVGHFLRLNKNTKHRVTEGTVTVDDEATFTVAGITFTLIHTPGETNDQLTVWIPDWRVVMPADNIYESFPNLYAIRGSPPRESCVWFRSLDKVRHLRAKYMVPSHTRPLKGEKVIFDTITHYRDAIQFVHDQTIRYMNKDMDIGEIVERVQLPPSLASHPFLQEYYGKVSWSVRSVYDGQLGWFDGDPVNLEPLSKPKRMKKMEELLIAGDATKLSAVEKMVSHADECLEKSNRNFNLTGHISKDDLQWALELASGVLKLVQPNSLVYEEAKKIAIGAVTNLAKSSINANARHYYLTYAKELETGDKDFTAMSKESRNAVIADTKVSNIMEQFSARFMADLCDDKLTQTVIFEFTDISQAFSYTMRHCVLEYVTDSNLFPKDFDAKLTLTSSLWKDIITNKRSAVSAYASGELTLEGSMLSLKLFMDLLEK